MLVWIFDVILSIFVEVLLTTVALYATRYVGSAQMRKILSY